MHRAHPEQGDTAEKDRARKEESGTQGAEKSHGGGGNEESSWVPGMKPMPTRRA